MTFGGILDSALRRPDQAFRIGGDEFALLLAEASEDDARAVVGRARDKLAATEDSRLESMRASYGVASCPADATDAQALFRLADEALYLAKRNRLRRPVQHREELASSPAWSVRPSSSRAGGRADGPPAFRRGTRVLSARACSRRDRLPGSFRTRLRLLDTDQEADAIGELEPRYAVGVDPVATWQRWPRVRSPRAEVRPVRAGQRRTGDLGARSERPVGRPRLLDRGRVARREGRPRRRLALHRAPAVQGLPVVRRAADRGDLRRDGGGAERRDVAGAHRRLLPRPRPARRDGARRHDGHGLRARVRGARPGARRRPRGDRDVRGHAAGARARPLLRGGLRPARARPAGDRDRRRDLDGQPPRDRRVSPLDVHGREHRRLRCGEHPARQARRAAAEGRAGERGRAARAARSPAARADAAAGSPLSAQGHRAVPRVPRRDRHLAFRPAPLRRIAPRLDPRRVGVVAPLPGDPREARDGVCGLQLRVAVHRHRADRDLRRHARGEPRRVHRDLRRADGGDRGGQAPQGRGRARTGEPEGADHALDGVDVEPDEPARQVADRGHRAADASSGSSRRSTRSTRRRWRSSRRCCSRPSGCLRPASARTRRSSAPPSSARTPGSAREQQREGRALRRGREGRAAARARARARGPRGARLRDRRRDRRRRAATRRSTSRHRTQRRRTFAPRSSRASRASSARPAGTRRRSARWRRSAG